MGTSANPTVDPATQGTPGATGSTDPGTGTTGDGTPPAGGTSGLDRTRLDPRLAHLNEGEINSVFNTMMEAIATRSGAPAAPAAPAAPPAPPPDLRPRFDPNDPNYDPEGAVREIFTRNYGPLANDIATRANEAVYMNYRSQYPDFHKFEKDVRSALNAAGTPGSPEQIGSLYFAFKGQEITRREAADRHAASTQPPAPPRREEPQAVALSAEEERVARILYRNHVDPIGEYRKDLDRINSGPVVMKVKLSDGRTA